LSTVAVRRDDHVPGDAVGDFRAVLAAYEMQAQVDHGCRPGAGDNGSVLGIALPAAGTGGAAWAEQTIPAGTAALLLASVPGWMIIASRVADGERITRRAAAGLVLGVAGVVVLVNPLAGGAPDQLPSAVALSGALFWGCGSVYAKRAPRRTGAADPRGRSALRGAPGRGGCARC
jgi:drug/metabolite transporter (DMT)-like permease